MTLKEEASLLVVEIKSLQIVATEIEAKIKQANDIKDSESYRLAIDGVMDDAEFFKDQLTRLNKKIVNYIDLEKEGNVRDFTVHRWYRKLFKGNPMLKA